MVSSILVILASLAPLIVAWLERQGKKKEESIRDKFGTMSPGEVADALARAAARARERMRQKVDSNP